MQEYKPIIISLIRFFVIYLAFTGLYYLYLAHYHNELMTCDPFTEIVARQSSGFLNYLGYNSEVFHYNQDNFMRFFINRKSVSIINEGCNALSVIILYVSFIVAFPSTLKKTGIYLLITVLLLYIVNILRISLLSYISYFYPQFIKEAHDYVFPSIIYGTVMLFWLFWMKCFVFKKHA